MSDVALSDLFLPVSHHHVLHEIAGAAELRTRLRTEIVLQNQQFRERMIYSPHDPVDAMTLAEVTVEPDDWPGRVLHVEKLGSDTVVLSQLDTGQTAIARVTGPTALCPRDRIALKPDHIRRFDASGQALPA